MSKHSRWAGPLFDGHICSVGYEVLDWIVEYTCHGIGDIQGERFEGALDLDDEIRDHIIRCYEIDPETGRRKVNEAVFSRPKGRAKSEIAGVIATAEAFAPTRFDGWGADGQPKARPVKSPLIKCLATEESQAGNTFANIAYIAGEWGQDMHPEIYGGSGGVRRYQSASAIYLPQGGEIRASTSGAASKDGGLETHVVADETHLYVLPELKSMYATISRNLGKRKDSDAWLHQTSTAYRPGEQSVFETTLTMWRKKELPDSVFVNHREATGKIDLEDKERTIRQLKEVYGPASEWIDLDRKYRDMRDPRVCADDETAARYFLNRPMSSKDAWIPDDIVKRQAIPAEVVATGTDVALGFDGSLNDDSTVLIASRMSDGFVFPIEIWAKPEGPAGNWWEVPRSEVLAKIRETFTKYNVTRLYADPHEWRSDIDALAEEFEDRVFPWTTGRDTAMHAALDRLRTDLVNGSLFHNGDGVMVEHFSNSYVRNKGVYRLVRNEHPKSDRKIDSVIGASLAYEARADAISAGWSAAPKRRRVIVS
jgi:phage terminase large subunit-like protein